MDKTLLLLPAAARGRTDFATMDIGRLLPT
jgi:hypothetical protein